VLAREEVAQAKNFLDLATLLLRCCRKFAAELHATLNNDDRAREMMERTRRSARHAFNRDRDFRLKDCDRKMVDEILFAGSNFPPCLYARALALAIDECKGNQFLTRFLLQHRDKEWEPKPGDPLPVAALNMEHFRRKAKVGKKNSPTRPERLSESFDQLPHLRLVPELNPGWTIKLDTRFARVLDTLRGQKSRYEITIGTALLNRESENGKELQWDVYEEGQIYRFFNVQPVNPDQQLKRMQRALQKARLDTDILVFPELCTTFSGQQSLIEEFRTNPGKIKILVAGSCHIDSHSGDGGRNPRRNQTMVAMEPGNSQYAHCKIHPFTYFAATPKSDDPVEHHEAIQSRKEFRICLSREWFLSVLICKDCLDDEVLVSLLKRFGVNLLLVPSHTDEIDPFDALLRPLVITNLAVVALANNPMERIRREDGPRDGHALFLGPIGKKPIPPKQIQGNDLSLPLVCRFRPLNPERGIEVS